MRAFLSTILSTDCGADVKMIHNGIGELKLKHLCTC